MAISSAARWHPLRLSALACLNMAAKKSSFAGSAPEPSIRAPPLAAADANHGCHAPSRANRAFSSVSALCDPSPVYT